MYIGNDSQKLLIKEIVMQIILKREESDPAFIEQQKIEKAAKDNRDFQQTVEKAADEKAATARQEGAEKLDKKQLDKQQQKSSR
jgi:hypothetical protein